MPSCLLFHTQTQAFVCMCVLFSSLQLGALVEGDSRGITVSPQSASRMESEYVVFDCFLNDLPLDSIVNISWTKQGGDVDMERAVRFSTTARQSAHLLLYNLRPEDEGSYECHGFINGNDSLDAVGVFAAAARLLVLPYPHQSVNVLATGTQPDHAMPLVPA
eukprot:scpid104900/ scgid0974/ 